MRRPSLQTFILKTLDFSPFCPQDSLFLKDAVPSMVLYQRTGIKSRPAGWLPSTSAQQVLCGERQFLEGPLGTPKRMAYKHSTQPINTLDLTLSIYCSPIEWDLTTSLCTRFISINILQPPPYFSKAIQALAFSHPRSSGSTRGPSEVSRHLSLIKGEDK